MNYTYVTPEDLENVDLSTCNQSLKLGGKRAKVVAHLVNELMREKALTIEDLANLASVSVNTVQRLRKADTPGIRTCMLFRVVTALGAKARAVVRLLADVSANQDYESGYRRIFASAVVEALPTKPLPRLGDKQVKAAGKTAVKKASKKAKSKKASKKTKPAPAEEPTPTSEVIVQELERQLEALRSSVASACMVTIGGEAITVERYEGAPAEPVIIERLGHRITVIPVEE